MPRPADSKSLTADQKKNERSRKQEMEEADVMPPLPDVGLPQMVAWADQVGWYESSDMGGKPLTWSTLRDWQWNMHLRLSPWEAETLRMMSIAYLSMADKAREVGCPSPMGVETIERNRERVAAQVRSMITGNVRRVKRSQPRKAA